MNSLSSNNNEKQSQKSKIKLPRIDMKWMIIIVAVVILAYFSVVPMIYLIIRGIFFDGKIDFQSYITVYSSIINWSALSNTFKLATLAMLLSLLITFPLAWLVGRTNLPGKKNLVNLFDLTNSPFTV